MSDVKFGLVHDFNSALTGGGTFDHEDSNFGGGTPKAVLHMVSRSTVLNTPANHFSMCMGAAKSATTGELFMLHTVSQHGTPTSDTYRDQREVLAAYLGDPNAADNSRDGHHDFSAFATNKITYTVGNTYPSAFGLATLLFGGADLNVTVGTVDLGSNTVGTEEFIVTGFDMNNSVVMLFGTGSGWQAESVITSPTVLRNMWGMGSYDGTTFLQASIGMVESDDQGTSDPSIILNDSHIIQKGDALYAQEWTSVDTTSGGRFGLTTRIANTDTEAKFGYIAIGLPSDWNANVSVQDLPTSVSNPTTFSPGFSGWTPKILIQILTLLESVDTAVFDNQAGGLGCRLVIGTDADDEICVSGNIEDAAATTDTEVGIHDSGFLNEDDGTTGYEMDLNGFISGGWKDDFVNVMGNAKKTICLVMGQDDAAAAPSQNLFINQAVKRASTF